MKILVTGGAGYLGSVLSLALIEEGHDVRILDNLMYGGGSILPIFGHPRFDFIIGDIRDSSVVERASVIRSPIRNSLTASPTA